MPAGVSHDVLQVLHTCRAIELAMAALYDTLAEIHRREPAVARLWRKTAREETNHAAQFSLLLEGMPDAVQATRLALPALESLRLAVETTVEELRLRKPTVREALVMVIDFEEAMDRIHAHQAVTFRDLRSRRMFEAMMAADSGHVSRMRTALRELGTRP